MYDFIVIGGGIVGLSAAWHLLQRFPGKRVVVIEKESQLAMHQTGRNSGVIHAGVYYAPGSLKAEFCRQGLRATLDFCEQYNVTCRTPGKLLVATSPAEHQRMLDLKTRCEANGLQPRQLSGAELRELEPAVAGVGALHIANTGIVDFRLLTEAIATQFRALGGEIHCGEPVVAVDERRDEVVVSTPVGDYRSKFLVACAGLAADRVARMMGAGQHFQIIPFRGEYYQLPEAKRDLVKHLIYPIPDPAMPFLGVHLTPMIGGELTVGPNALLGWQREGYGQFNVSVRDSVEMLCFPGFWRVAGSHWQAGLSEMRDGWCKRSYLKRVQKYCPELTLADLRSWPVGVRAQAVLRDGSLVQDFLFENTPRSLHVCNAPSPAATSAIPIGRYLAEEVARRCQECC
jgi:L-2-hydroxyglutarate oxidase